MQKKPFHEHVAENLIEQLQQGTAPWQKPWQPGEPGAFLPINPTSGKRYKGINAIHLMSQERDDQRWMTYKQAAALGAQVRKGEKGTQVQYWKFSDEQVVKDVNGKPVLDSKGDSVKAMVELERPRVFFSTVFNAEQIDGLPPLARENQEWNAIERAEKILLASGAMISHGGRDQAYYRPATDSIHLPDKGRFPHASNYYATALHELGHWTGHESRLARDLAHPFGSEGYAKEELRAEIASMMLGDELGIGHDPGQHAAYVNSWIKALQDDPREIFRAAADAEKIQELVLSFEKEHAMETAYVLADYGLCVVREDGEFGDFGNVDQAKKFSTPEEALKEALKVKEIHAERLEGSQIYVHEIEPGGRMAEKSIIQTGTPNDMKVLWRLKVKEELPDFLKEPQVIQHENVETARILDSKTPELDNGRTHATSDAERVYLTVPFKEKEAAKALGAKWDKDVKSWYVPEGVELTQFAVWRPNEKHDPSAMPAAHLLPQEEFAQMLHSAGLIVEDAPVMDGKIHRVPVVGAKGGTTDGAYCGYMNGRANGWAQNYKTGEKIKWISTGHVLTEKGKAEMTTVSKGQLIEMQARALKRAYARWMNAPEAKEHPYLTAKGIEGDWDGLKKDADGNLLIPGFNIYTGMLQTLQRISPEGVKRFEAGCPKSGAACLIAQDDNKDITGEILIAEGYATGASLYQATGIPVAVAFDANNLLDVAENIRGKYPHIEITICADNDHSNKTGVNVGVEKAKEAALAVGGKVVIPSFTSEEKAIGCTDFNDLLASRGKEAVKKNLSKTRSNGVER